MLRSTDSHLGYARRRGLENRDLNRRKSAEYRCRGLLRGYRRDGGRTTTDPQEPRRKSQSCVFRIAMITPSRENVHGADDGNSMKTGRLVGHGGTAKRGGIRCGSGRDHRVDLSENEAAEAEPGLGFRGSGWTGNPRSTTQTGCTDRESGGHTSRLPWAARAVSNPWCSSRFPAPRLCPSRPLRPT